MTEPKESALKTWLKAVYYRLEPFKWWVLGGIVVIFLAINYVLANFFIPNQLTLAIGDPRGDYARMGRLLQSRLAEKGIELKLLESAGSEQNLTYLLENKADVAFLQSGLITADKIPADLSSVASVYHEPIFLFYRRNLPLENIADLRGRRVAVGQYGSGTWTEVQRLLQKHELGPQDLQARHLNYSQLQAQLLSNQLDAAFLVAGIDSGIVRDLVSAPEIAVLPFEHYKSYQYYFSHLGKLVIPSGYYSLSDNIPAEDIPLITLMATLVCQKDLHNRLVEVMLIALKDIFEQERTNERLPLFSAGDIQFPSERFTTVPLHPTAEVFFTEGPSLLASYFSYHVLFFLGRIKYLLIPMLPALLLFSRVAPGAYRYRLMLLLKAKYKELMALEQRVMKTQDPEELAALHQELEVLLHSADEELSRIPAHYQRDVYDWKMHLRMVQNMTQAAETSGSASAPASPPEV